ncbi:FUSC family protein [Pullulanibacillus camelliae]|nr:FUSC family protein [Pullulanibacillus camelliae]
MMLIEKIKYWWARIVAADPGRIRLLWASKVIVSVMVAVGLMTLVTALFGKAPITVVIFAGVLAMLSNVTVNDDSVASERITTLLLPLSSALALTLATFLERISHVYVDIFLLLIIFSTLYLQRFMNRYFSICMVAFMSIYFSALLQVQFSLLGWLYVAIGISILSTFCVKFVFWKERPDKTLDRAVGSFRIQVNLTLELLTEIIDDLQLRTRRIHSLENNVLILNEYARTVSEQLDSEETGETWRGIPLNRIRLYIFDSAMLMETLASAVRQLKLLRAFEYDDVRVMLVQLMRCLRHVSALRGELDSEDLRETERVLEQLKRQLGPLKADNKDIENWVYLLRRIQSITRHIIKGIRAIEQSKNKKEYHEHIAPFLNAEEVTEQGEGEQTIELKADRALSPELRKAIQAVLAGAIAIALGYLLSPSHKYWMLLSGFVVFFGTASVGRTMFKAFQRFLGTLIGAIVGFALDSLIIGKPAIEVPLLFLSIFLGFYFVRISYTLMSFWITMMLAIMYNLLLGGVNEQLLLYRVFDTLVGAGLGACATAVFLPKKTELKIKEAMVEFLAALSENISAHLERLMDEPIQVNGAQLAFNLESKLADIRAEADPLRRPQLRIRQRGIVSEYTTFVAINYYAKHLVASSYRSRVPGKHPHLNKTLKKVKQLLNKNIITLCQLLSGDVKGRAVVWEMQKERECIERSPDNDGEVARTLINDMYYIWRINKSIVALSERLGAHKYSTQESQTTSYTKEI